MTAEADIQSYAEGKDTETLQNMRFRRVRNKFREEDDETV